MLISLSHDLGSYLYEVFVVKMDLWFVFGLGAQLIFTARFLVQWIASERAGRSVIPLSFWLLSMAGGLMTLGYGFARKDAIIILGQVLSVVIYGRNLMLIARSGRGRSEPE
jgi:lipid-A-disaccharide synthase-like uncharacterized protein